MQQQLRDLQDVMDEQNEKIKMLEEKHAASAAASAAAVSATAAAAAANVANLAKSSSKQIEEKLRREFQEAVSALEAERDDLFTEATRLERMKLSLQNLVAEQQVQIDELKDAKKFNLQAKTSSVHALISKVCSFSFSFLFPSCNLSWPLTFLSSRENASSHPRIMTSEKIPSLLLRTPPARNGPESRGLQRGESPLPLRLP